MAGGKYLPEDLLPQEAEIGNDGGYPPMLPVYVTPTTVLAGHHALY